MKFKKVLVTGFNQSSLDDSTWSQIKKLSNSIVFESSPSADCLLCKFNKVDKTTIDSLPHLKYIGVLATGVGTVDTDYASKKKIVVTNIPGYSTESVAEWVFGLILEHLRSLEKAKTAARSKDFSGDGFTASEIKGKTFGIIGLGRIGKRVGEIAKCFGAKVLYWSRTRKKEYEIKGFKFEQIDKLIPQCDFLSLHLNKTKDTENILNAKRIRLIKKDAVVINVAPMELINLEGLEQRLQKGDITFICDHPDEMKNKDVERLMKHKSCIVYPPIGFISNEARVIKQSIFVSNLQDFLKGKPSNKVN